MLPLVTIWLAWLLPLGSPAFVPTTILLRAFQQPPQPPVSSPLEGAWEGTLQVGAIELRLGFTLQPKADTPPGEKIVLTGTMVSIDQGAAEIPVTRATLTSDTFQIVVPAAGASFTGTLNAARNTAEGFWYQGLNKLPLTLKKVPAITRLRRPQEPKPPFPYRAEEVRYENPTAKIQLAGTLTIPPGQGPFPAVLLITGSGPQDRDESLLGHKPFLVLADHLTRRGIVVLRVDDRGVGQSTGSFADATTLDFAEDALAGFRFLQQRSEVDPQRIGLLGHSEGGIIAPIVASKTPEVGYIVLLAGTALPGEEILYRQSRLIAQAEGAPPADIEANVELQRKIFAIVKAEPPGPEVVKKLNDMLKDHLNTLTPEQQKELQKGAGMQAIQAQLAQFSKPWLKTFMTYDPKTSLKLVQCPVLALNGELDLQVPWRENLEGIRETLLAAGNTRVTTKSFPNLNHLFQTCTTGSPTRYGKIEETLNPEVLEYIAHWILEQRKK